MKPQNKDGRCQSPVGNLLELFEDTDNYDILLPEQYNQLLRRGHDLPGELRLMFAVLEDAIECYLVDMKATTRRRRNAFYEVRLWMNSSHAKGIFAFETLCETLGIDASRLRHSLEQRSLEVSRNQRQRVRNGNSSRIRRRARVA
jgi:hypothetical protein